MSRPECKRCRNWLKETEKWREDGRYGVLRRGCPKCGWAEHISLTHCPDSECDAIMRTESDKRRIMHSSRTMFFHPSSETCDVVRYVESCWGTNVVRESDLGADEKAFIRELEELGKQP